MGRDRKSNQQALAALTSALAALPAYQSHASETGYRFSHYREAELAAGQSADGQSQDRYEIQTHQLQHQRSLTDNWNLDADLMVETMSGASPWFVLPDGDGGAVQVMSGASIEEKRIALAANLARETAADQRWSARLGLSDEDDYTAFSGGLVWELDQQQRTRTWSLGLALSDDQLAPTDGGSAQFPERIVQADKRSLRALVGVSQILSPRSVMQLGLSYERDSGYLSDPYKLVFVDGQTEADSRPQQRNQWALTARLRHYMKRLGTALHVDWRHFQDDWDISSDTLELGVLGRVQERWRWSTRLRWYQQSQADFYGPFFEQAPADRLYSSDYRLSPYGALSLRAGVDYFADQWALALAVESYDSDSRYAAGSVALENPGLVDFTIVSIAFSWGFGGGAGAASSKPDAPTDNVHVIGP